MTAQEQLAKIQSTLAQHKARAYDLKNQLEYEENQIIGLYGAAQVAEQLAAVEAQASGAQDGTTRG